MNDLLKAWHNMKDRDYYSASDRKNNVHYHIKNQLDLSKRSRLGVVSSASGYLERVIKLKYLGKMIREIVQDESEDIDEILNWLNIRDNRWIRDYMNIEDTLDSIFNVEIRSCNDCNYLDHNDNFNWAYDDYRICEGCRDRHYHYSEYRDTYVRDDDEEADDDGVIGEYHSSSENLGHIPSSFDKRKKPIYLGLELEVEVSDSVDRVSKAQEILDAIGIHRSQIDKCSHQYALCESDGSLDHGFEIVTGYTGLDVHATQLEFFKNRWARVRSHDTSTCGLHIHICKNDMTLYHASKLVLFINAPDNEKLIYTLARRSSDNYAKFHDKKGNLNWLKNAKSCERKRDQLRNLNGDRYEALNFQNDNTIEFRLFKGTLKYQTIMACLEFTYASWFFTLDASINDLSTDKFIEFICKPENKRDTINLRAYLQDKGYRLPKSGLIKTNPRTSSPVVEVVEI